ncbi:hypothetical protein BJX96DRAFT_147248 [Aspergillus floccosus]
MTFSRTFLRMIRATCSSPIRREVQWAKRRSGFGEPMAARISALWTSRLLVHTTLKEMTFTPWSHARWKCSRVVPVLIPVHASLSNMTGERNWSVTNFAWAGTGPTVWI